MPSDASPTDVNQDDNLLVEAVSVLVRRQRETETWVSEQLGQAEERAEASERRYAALETRLAGIEEQIARLVREFQPGAGGVLEDERLARLRDQLEALKSDTNGHAAHIEGSSGATPISRAAEAPNGAPIPRTAEARLAEPPLPPGAAVPPAVEAAGGASSTRAGASGVVEAPGAAPSARAGAPYAAEAPTRALSSAAAPPGASAAPSGTLSPPPVAPASPIEASGASAPATAPTGPTARAGRSSSFLDLLGDTPQDRFGLILMGVGLIALVYAILTQLHIG